MDGERRALDPPRQPVVVLDWKTADAASEHARRSSRKRVIQPYHKSHEDRLHRMLNAAEPGTYIRPHRHLEPPKPEAFVLLRGALDFLVFDDDGGLSQVVPLRPGGEAFGVDVEPGIFHCFLAREPGTLIYEVKTGPYERASDKDFAAWAPAEDSPEARTYLQSLEQRVETWLVAETA